ARAVAQQNGITLHRTSLQRRWNSNGSWNREIPFQRPAAAIHRVQTLGGKNECIMVIPHIEVLGRPVTDLPSVGCPDRRAAVNWISEQAFMIFPAGKDNDFAIGHQRRTAEAPDWRFGA